MFQLFVASNSNWIFILLFAFVSLCVAEDVVEVGGTGDLEKFAESIDDTFIEIHIINNKEKFPPELDAFQLECLEKIRPVLSTCLEERVLKTYHLGLRPKCPSRIQKFKEWANNTCDGLIEFKSNRNSTSVVESWFFRFKSWVQSVFQAVEMKIKECVRRVLNFFQPEEMQEHIRSVSRFVQAEETQENMRGIISFLQAQETHELFTLLGSFLFPDSSSLLHRGTGLRTGQTSGPKSSVRPAIKVRAWGLGSKSSGLRPN